MTINHIDVFLGRRILTVVFFSEGSVFGQLRELQKKVPHNALGEKKGKEKVRDTLVVRFLLRP